MIRTLVIHTEEISFHRAVRDSDEYQEVLKNVQKTAGGSVKQIIKVCTRDGEIKRRVIL